MKQMSLSRSGFELVIKKTRKSAFLFIDWHEDSPAFAM